MKRFSKKLLRRSLVVMLCLCMVLQGFLQVYAAGEESADSGYCSYEWTRIDSEDELRNYVEKGKTDQDAGRRFIDNTIKHDINDDDSSHWFKVLIAYKFDDVAYFCSGSTMVSDGEDYACARVLPQYFYDLNGNPQHIGDKTLNSTSGLYAPYIKYQGEENGDPRVFVRLAEAAVENGVRTDKMGSEVLIGNLSWYGVAHHAAAYGELVKTKSSNPGGYVHGCACSHSEYHEFIMKWHDDIGKMELYFCPSGSSDRYWTHSNNSKITITQSHNCADTEFYLYFGVPSINKLIDASLIVESMTTTYNTAIITERSVLEIPRGSCVVMDGLCKLNGSILVNGGVLIIKGTLDTSASVPYDSEIQNFLMPGSIKVTNGGTLYVEDTGVMCLRLGSSNLIADRGGKIVIDGGSAVAGKISLDEGYLYVNNGAALIHGAKIPELTSAQNLGKAGIAANKEFTLDYFVSDGRVDSTFGSNQGTLSVKGNSFFMASGLYYRNPINDGDESCVSYDSVNTVVNVKMRTNYHAKIADMMWTW